MFQERSTHQIGTYALQTCKAETPCGPAMIRLFLLALCCIVAFWPYPQLVGFGRAWSAVYEPEISFLGFAKSISINKAAIDEHSHRPISNAVKFFLTQREQGLAGNWFEVTRSHGLTKLARQPKGPGLRVIKDAGIWEWSNNYRPQHAKIVGWRLATVLDLDGSGHVLAGSDGRELGSVNNHHIGPKLFFSAFTGKVCRSPCFVKREQQKPRAHYANANGPNREFLNSLSAFGHTFLRPQVIMFVIFGVLWGIGSLKIGTSVRPKSPLLEAVWLIFVVGQYTAVMLSGAMIVMG